MSTYAVDYDAFGFERREFPATVERYLLSTLEQQLLRKFHALAERTSGDSRAARSRTGDKYAVREVARAVRRRVRNRNTPPDPRDAHI